MANVQCVTAAGQTAPTNPGPLLQEVSVTLTNAQMLAMFTTPIQIIPAPGAGFLVQVYRIRAIHDSSAGAYSGVTGSFLLTYGPTSATSIYSLAQALAIGTTVRRIQVTGPSTQIVLNTVLDNVGIFALWATANPGGGNAANSCVITISYEILSA